MAIPMIDGFFSWLDPQWVSTQVGEENLGSFVAWTVLMLAAGFAVGRMWRNRVHEIKMARMLAERDDDVALYQRQVDTLTKQLEASTEMMNKTSSEIYKSIDVSESVREHISSQDAQLESFYNTILRMKELIDKMNDIITALTKDRMAMLSDAERDALEMAYRSELPCEMGDEDVAEHLVALGALDRLSTGRYAVSGEWRRSMRAIPSFNVDSEEGE